MAGDSGDKLVERLVWRHQQAASPSHDIYLRPGTSVNCEPDGSSRLYFVCPLNGIKISLKKTVYFFYPYKYWLVFGDTGVLVLSLFYHSEIRRNTS